MYIDFNAILSEQKMYSDLLDEGQGVVVIVLILLLIVLGLH